MRDNIFTENAPSPIGPYSQAVIASGKTLFISGQIPLDKSGNLAGETLELQTRQVLDNLKAVVTAAGGSLNNIVRVGVYMTDLGKFAEMNAIYNEYFGDIKPARSAIEVSRLPKDVMIEMDAIAVID